MRSRSRRSESGWEKEGLSVVFDDAVLEVEDVYLSRALQLAASGLPTCAPNPAVGCVVVSGERIVGEGFHERAGGPHAEVVALDEAGSAARGADVYVTLEPCSHHGRTPPCTDALIAAGVRSVTIGMRDPDPVAGGGAEVLARAGIEVSFAPDPRPFQELNRGWIKRIATGLPYVTVKVAVSLDGRVAARRGERLSITGEAGAGVTRRLRSMCDAIMVGAATVASDDPSLTVRDVNGTLAPLQPVRFVISRSGHFPFHASVFNDRAARTVALTAERSVRAPNGVELVHFDASRGVAGALAAIAGEGVNRLLVEPGPALMTSLVADGCIDELITVTAGGLLGEGASGLYEGPPVLQGDALERAFVPVDTGIVGDVVVTRWRPHENA